MDREWEVCSTNLAVSVTNEELSYIDSLDMDRLWFRGKKGVADELTLSEYLDKLEGVDNTDYNGHFGAFIFVRLEQGSNHAGTRALIEKTINDYLKLELSEDDDE